MNILHIGSYKAAGENYSRSKMSEPFKENLKTLFDIRFKNFIDTIKERRNYDPTEDILSGNLFFNSNKNLIDKRINKWELLDKEKIVTITSYKFKKKKQQKNVIAIVSLDGTISEKELSFEEVKKKVEKVNDIGTSLAGVILQINSPGGSAYESSLIYSYLKEKNHSATFCFNERCLCFWWLLYFLCCRQNVCEQKYSYRFNRCC